MTTKFCFKTTCAHGPEKLNVLQKDYIYLIYCTISILCVKIYNLDKFNIWLIEFKRIVEPMNLLF